MPSAEKLTEFVHWCHQHLSGAEKGEAQIFLDHLFQALGWAGGLKQAGATLEMRVPKNDSDGTAFADLVWKPVVLIEMKKRGTDLQKHYRQAFDYWVRLVPNRPRYVIRCNFDEFRVYDFETQLDSPKDTLALDQLPARWGPLAFLLPEPQKPSFGNDREAVTRRAANALALAFNRLVERQVERPLAQRFVLQFLVALFAEDIGLLPKYLVARLLEDCATPAQSHDPLGGLFEQMNNPRRATGGRYKDVPHFNGGLFAEPARLELRDLEIVELRKVAKVTMMIGRKLAIDELHITEPALPLDNLDRNFLVADALLTPDGQPAAWPKADVIIGNPPFLGAKRLKPERGPDYVNALRRAYPEVPGMADYCVYWFRKAAAALPACTPEDPCAGRAGLVGTQNIRNNQSRVGGLDYVATGGTIVEAVENQPWSGEANVHVAIANWVKTKDPALLPKTRKLWFKVEPSAAARKLRKRGTGPASKDFELDFRECEFINSALSDQTDVSEAKPLRCNVQPQRCFNGQMIGHAGFLLTPAQKEALHRSDPASAEILFPYLNGLDALTGAALSRYVLDFEQRHQLEAAAYSAAFEWVKTHVLPDRERKAKEGVDRDGKMRPHHKGFLSRWWQLSFGRPEMLSVLTPLPRYLACAYVTKRPIFMFVSSAIRPSNLIQVFGFADDYSFGILQSHTHWLWFVTKCGKLTERFRYSAESVFDTFPWPQFADCRRRREEAQTSSGAQNSGSQSLLTSAPTARIRAVAEAGREVRRVRAEALHKLKGGLRALYRTLELPGANPLKAAHAALDAAVLAAYGFDPKADLLAQLLALNLAVANQIERGEAVTAPGVPPGFPEPGQLVTQDGLAPPPGAWPAVPPL